MNNIQEIKYEDLTEKQKRDLETQGYSIEVKDNPNGKGLLVKIINIDHNGIIRSMMQEQNIHISLTAI